MYYYTLSDYLKQKFNTRVFKIPVDAGLTCPNRDGSKGVGGCIYCDNSSFVFASKGTVEEQVKEGIRRLERRNISRYIVYFQSYSNTYCSDEQFKELVLTSLIDERIVGLYIGTRPDVVNENKLRFLSQFTDKYDIFMEYGLQSIHDTTLLFINRGHLYTDFEKAVNMTKNYNIKITTHIILACHTKQWT